MFDRLAELAAEYEALEARLADIYAAGDQAAARDAGRRHAELKPIVETYERYRRTDADLDDARELLAGESDDEIREYLDGEITAKEALRADLERELNELLVAKDPNDGRNVIVEIRGAEGGDSTGQIAVANGEDWSVRWLDGKTLSLVRKVEAEGDADNLRFDAAAGLLYVGFGDGALAVIDKEARKKDIPLAGHPESFQLEGNGNRIFVNVPDANHIAVVDRTSGRVTTTWPTGDARENYPMALDEAGHRLYVGCRAPASLLAVDTANGAILSKTEISGDIDDVWVDASGKRLYCACGDGFLDVLERGTGDAWTRIAKVETAEGARTAIYDPKSGILLVAVPAKAIPTAEVRIYATR